MNPDWILGLVGGLMIGLAAATYLLVNGRILGASGIAGSVIDGSAGRTLPEKAALLGGLIAVPAIAVMLGLGESHQPVAPFWVLAIAGLSVGIGTRLANGCTSGHGVCGISRLSVRGIAATVTFLLTGGLAVLVSHWMGWGVTP